MMHVCHRRSRVARSLVVAAFLVSSVLFGISHARSGPAEPFWAIEVGVHSPGIPAEIWVFRYVSFEQCEAASAEVQRFFHLDNRPQCMIRPGSDDSSGDLPREEGAKAGGEPQI